MLGFDTEASDIELLEKYLSDRSGRRVNVRVPERGDAKKLCELVCENCREIVSRTEIESEREEKTLVRLAELLKLEVVPERIEAYDISNMGNDNITAGMITVEKGRFKKNMYRSYSIRQTGGKQDDYTSMEKQLKEG